jgi:hypothetical protein
MEESIRGDVALIRAWKVDEAGNVVFRYTAQNFCAAMARSARTTIVEAEHIVPVGELHPMQIHLPGIYVDRIVQATTPKQIENVTLKPEPGAAEGGALGKGAARAKREMIVKVGQLRRRARLTCSVRHKNSPMAATPISALACQPSFPTLSPRTARCGSSLRTVSSAWVLFRPRRRLTPISS